MAELLKIESYNDGNNKVDVIFRRLHAEYPATGLPFISVLCDEEHTGAAGNYTVPLTMHMSNEYQVLVYQMVNGVPEPVMVTPTPDLQEGEEGYEPPYQQTIGEFDMWRNLVFDNNRISINAAITKGIMIKKGLTTEPFAYILP